MAVSPLLMLMVTGPPSAEHCPWTKLIQGMVFGVALTLVIFAGAELYTSNMMTMVQGACRRRVSVGGAGAVIVVSLLGNLVGSVVFSWSARHTRLPAAAPRRTPCRRSGRTRNPRRRSRSRSRSRRARAPDPRNLGQSHLTCCHLLPHLGGTSPSCRGVHRSVRRLRRVMAMAGGRGDERT
nr:formate/nitrite transporter family protein [Streptomyces dengpaensis]